jgi:N-acetylneuraminate synthase
MDPRAWRDMVDRTRELENALGTGVKKVEDNEKETVVLQRRSVRAKVGLPAGRPIGRDELEVLRPCPEGAIEPYRMADVVGRKARRDIAAGEHLQWTDIELPS